MFSQMQKNNMENSKLFTSLNNKKGILLEIEEGNLNVSVWKKETPVSATLDKDSAMEICEFITSNLTTPVDAKENERKIHYWSKCISDARSGSGDWETSENSDEMTEKAD